MSKQDAPVGGEAAESSPVTFHYIKSNSFRIVHADGVHGGLTPRGWIEMNFYSERRPIPKLVAYAVSAEGNLGEEIRAERVERQGLVREVEIGVMIDLAAAEAFRAWLDDKIRTLRVRAEA